ncbi:MAG: phage holin family protein, partial [Bacteroidota bacterium]|nr:phage holin family protein [Bacteroidota bacterium]
TLSKFFKLDTIIENLTGLVETRVELLKVEARENISKALAQAVTYLFILFVAALFITFFSIAIALVVSERFGNFAGFWTVGALYLIIGLILWFSRDRIVTRLETRFSFMFRKKN